MKRLKNISKWMNKDFRKKSKRNRRNSKGKLKKVDSVRIKIKKDIQMMQMFKVKWLAKAWILLIKAKILFSKIIPTKHLKLLTNHKISVTHKKLNHQIDILKKIIKFWNISKTMMESKKVMKRMNRDTKQESQERKKKNKKQEGQVVEEVVKLDCWLKVKFK